MYLVMWLPSVFTIWIFDARMPGGNEIIFFGGLWSHLQGIITPVVFLRKRDVLVAVLPPSPPPAPPHPPQPPLIPLTLCNHCRTVTLCSSLDGYLDIVVIIH